MSDRATILAPDGTVASLAHRTISFEDAKLLRAYKQFLQRSGLREALYCNECWTGERSDGCEAHVTGDRILIRCRCSIRTYMGPSL